MTRLQTPEFVAENCVPTLMGHLQDNWDKQDAESYFTVLERACKKSPEAVVLCGKDGVRVALRAIRKKVLNNSYVEIWLIVTDYSCV